MAASHMAKPPAILIYAADHTYLEEGFRNSLNLFLPQDVYTFSHLTPEWIQKSHWIEPSTCCLILADQHKLDHAAWNQIQNYFMKGGRLLIPCDGRLPEMIADFDASEGPDMSSFRLMHCNEAMARDLQKFLDRGRSTREDEMSRRYQCEGDSKAGHNFRMEKKRDEPLCLEVELNGGRCCFTDSTCEHLMSKHHNVLRDCMEYFGVKTTGAGMERPRVTGGYMAVDDECLTKCKLDFRYGNAMGNSPQLVFAPPSHEGRMPDAREDFLPIKVMNREEACKQCEYAKRYFDRLQTNSLGKTALFIPVTTTTMDVARSLHSSFPSCRDVIVIARQQLHGKGRSGNEWLSPMGVAMWTFNFFIPKTTTLSKHPSFVQQIVATAVVEAVHELSGVKDFPLKIKWPNDFYDGRETKIGGLFVQSSDSDKDERFYSVGVGINVSNQHPTTCLNAMRQGIEFREEEVIACSLNHFERLLNMYENKGLDTFLLEYYKHWLHSNDEVTLSDSDQRCTIEGIDSFGYLLVKDKKTGKTFSVSDDGNTFDMMKSLIKMKMV